MWRTKTPESQRVKYWEIIADNLHKAGWSYGYVSALDREGRTIWIVDAAVSADNASPRARGGRPTLYVPKIVDRLLAYIADGLNIKQACAAVCVSPRTLADWRIDHPEIVPRLEAAREASRAKALAKIKAASKDDWRSIAEWLRLSFSQDYMRGNTVNGRRRAQRTSARARTALGVALHDTYG